MKKLIIISALALLFTACDEQSQQVGVLETAFKALQNNDSKTFYSLLTSLAKEKYGNERGMQQLKSRLEQAGSLSVGKDKVISSREDSDNSSVIIYEIPILSRQNEIMKAQIKCITTRSTWESEECHDPNPPRHDDRDRDHRDDREPNPPRYVEPREPSEPGERPPRYVEPSEPKEPRPREPRPPMLNGIPGLMSYQSGGLICRTVTHSSHSTNCKVADLR